MNASLLTGQFKEVLLITEAFLQSLPGSLGVVLPKGGQVKLLEQIHQLSVQIPFHGTKASSYSSNWSMTWR